MTPDTAIALAAPAAIAFASVLAAGGLTWLAWGRRPKRSPEDRAFRTLTRRAGLREEEIAIVERLARAHPEAHPVALLLSAHAFDLAARAGARRIDPRTAARVRALRERLHPGAPPGNTPGSSPGRATGAPGAARPRPAAAPLSKSARDAHARIVTSAIVDALRKSAKKTPAVAGAGGNGAVAGGGPAITR